MVDSPATSQSPGGIQPIPKKSQQIKTDKPRPHICTICTRAFARLEHLKRHERSHTNEKPFQCAACGRCFARRDLVLRHQQKLHGSLHSVMRRGSSREMENEYVIVLQNNTNANAPLSTSSFDSRVNTPGGPQATGAPGNPQYNSKNTTPLGQVTSPLRTGDLEVSSGGISGPPSQPSRRDSQQLNSLFNHVNANSNPQSVNRYSGSSDAIPSPNKTISSNNTPPNASSSSSHHHHHHQQLQSVHALAQGGHNPTQQPSPQATDSPTVHSKTRHYSHQKPSQSQSHPPSHHVHHHTSFSATSGTSYTNFQDALDIQQKNADCTGPMQVDFATPQLSALELNAKGMLPDLDVRAFDFESSNMETLGLSAIANPPDFHELQTNTGEMTTDPTTAAGAADSKQKHLTDHHCLISHQFQNPKHPHYIKDLNPLELGENHPTESSLVHLVLQMDTGSMGGSSGTGYDVYAKSSTKRGDSSTNVNGEGPIDHSEEGQHKRKKANITMHPGSTSWFKDIMSSSLEAKQPSTTQQGGLVDARLESQFTRGSDDSPGSYRSRQIDLANQLKKLLKLKEAHNDVNYAFRIEEKEEKYLIEKFRKKIILVSNVHDSEFPPLDHLNNYMVQFEREFDKYFSFIQMPFLKSQKSEHFEHAPLILAMCAVGALYSYHDSNALLLFNLSKLHFQQFFEREVTMKSIRQKQVPLMAHQCLLLHAFISTFINQHNMLEVTVKQVKSLAGLIKSTNFDNLEDSFLTDPTLIMKETDPEEIQKHFAHFVRSQSRIRTLYCFYILEVFVTFMTGTPISLSGSEIMCGANSFAELWRCDSAGKWHDHLANSVDYVTSARNSESLAILIKSMGHNINSSKLSFNHLLALLSSIHEQILCQLTKPENANLVHWMVYTRPKIESLIKSWEALFVLNGGTLVINEHNRHLLATNSELKLLLPSLNIVKIELCVPVSAIIRKVLERDWVGVVSFTRTLDNNHHGLKDSVSFSLEIMTLWLHNVLQETDRKKTSPRTPVFFITSLFVASVMISNYLYALESLVDPRLDFSDRIVWIQCFDVLAKIENAFISNRNISNYLDQLKKEAGNSMVYTTDTQSNAHRTCLVTEYENKKVIHAIKMCKLSRKALLIGISLLTDTPVWPLAMGFAEALRKMTEVFKRPSP